MHAVQNVIGALKLVVSKLALRIELATQDPVVSSKEDWLARAKALREHGQEAQAKAIEARFVTILGEEEQCIEAAANLELLHLASLKKDEVVAEPPSSMASSKLDPTDSKFLPVASLTPETQPELSVAKPGKKTIKKALKLSAEEELEFILDALVAGDVGKVNVLLAFPFHQLNAYKGLTPDQQIARNLPAVTLIDYFARHSLTVMAPPAPFLTALMTYLEEISSWKRLDEKQQGRQDAFMSLLQYRTTTTPLPLALTVLRKLNKDSDQKKFIENFKQQRRETFNSALTKGQVHIVPNLVRLGLLDTPDKEDLTPLHIAAKQNHIKLIDALINAGAVINKTNGNGETALYFAVKNKNKKTVSALLQAKPDVNCRLTAKVDWLLIGAVTQGSLDIVQLLINAGANVNQTTTDGFSPLTIATKNGFIDIVRALIAAGAEVNQKTKGSAALSIALENGHITCASLLIKLGADVNEVNESGFSPIHIAVEDGEQELVEELVAAGADVNKKANDEEGFSPLCLAAETNLEMVQLLIKLGADINQTTVDNRTPLLIAVIHDCYEIIDYLVSFKHCKMIAFQTCPEGLLKFIEDYEDDLGATSRAEDFIKTKIADAEGKIAVLPHEMAAIFDRKNIQQLLEDNIKTLTDAHNSYRFYSAKQEDYTAAHRLEDKALRPR